ncbi:HAD family hydrolase [Celerinatantimonas yamalensis]|uniref:HAD family hydrolase n=1 Tax=Celerinatantimonas yamalensis TaxID=559956 RepID=A0ABW9G5L3_9GAMM
MPNTLTIFDLDDTLLNGDTMALWHRFLVQQKIVTNPDEFLTKDREFDALYRSGKMNIAEFLQFSLSPIADYSAEQVDALVQKFIDEQVIERLYPQAKQLVEDLVENHHHLLMISATVDFIVRPVAKLFGITDVLAINVARQQGVYTPQIIGTPSFREGKVIRLQQWLTTQSWQPDELRFYTDSINDLPLLEQVDEPYVVNPCEALREIANRRNWPILEWQTVTDSKQ